MWLQKPTSGANTRHALTPGHHHLQGLHLCPPESCQHLHWGACLAILPTTSELTKLTPLYQVALKNDPTILGTSFLRKTPTAAHFFFIAWETGNEYGGYMLGGGAPPAEWTKDIASYIKSLAPNHLVMDGTDGLVDSNGNLQNTGVTVGPADMV